MVTNETLRRVKIMNNILDKKKEEVPYERTSSNVANIINSFDNCVNFYRKYGSRIVFNKQLTLSMYKWLRVLVWETIDYYSKLNKVSKKKVKELYLKTFFTKNLDYGDSFFDTASKFGLVSCFTRMYDKKNRIVQLQVSESEINYESLNDSVLDLGVYALMSAYYITTFKSLNDIYPIDLYLSISNKVYYESKYYDYIKR